MEANELRISNLVHSIPHHNVIEIKAVGNRSRFLESIQGIPLEGNVFYALGFRWVGFGRKDTMYLDISKNKQTLKAIVVYKNKLMLRESYSLAGPNFSSYDDVITISRKPLFVHTIQNLFYSLTLEELPLIVNNNEFYLDEKKYKK